MWTVRFTPRRRSQSTTVVAPFGRRAGKRTVPIGRLPFMWLAIVLICAVKDIAAINAPASLNPVSAHHQRLNQQTAVDGDDTKADQRAMMTTHQHQPDGAGSDLLLSEDESSREIRAPQKWISQAAPIAEEALGNYPQPTDNPHVSAEWNGQEPMRRRRRKRKRRPQQQQPNPSPPVQLAEVSVSLQAAEPTKYWRGQVEDDSEALHERDGIIVSINQQIAPNPSIEPVDAAVEPDPSPPSLQPWQNRQKAFIPNSIKKLTHEPEDEEPQQSQHVEPVVSAPDRSYRRPYGIGRKEEAASAAGGSSALKNILKNSGGLSLSEILQQQNLSLDDLLKGKQNALKALQSTTEDPNNPDEMDNTPSVKPSLRRVPTGHSRPTALPGSEPVIHEIPSKPPRWRQSDSEGDARPRLPSITTKHKLVEAEPTIPSSVQPDITEAEVHIVGTMASFLIPHQPNIESDTDNASQATPVRRLPSPVSDRIKSIKEVVSGIRPDLHNSNTRKRVSSLQSRPNQTEPLTPVAAILKPEIREVKIPPRFSASNRIKSISTSTTTEGNVQAIHEISTESSSTEPPTSTTTHNPVKNRLALRPRLKQLSTTTTTTTTTSTTTTTTTTEEPVETTVLEEVEETTIQPDTQSDFSFSQTSHEIIESAEPEFNSIEQLPALEEAAAESGIGSIESIEPIEQLFAITFNEAGHPIDVTARSEPVQIQERFTLKTTTKLDVTERNPSLFLDITSSRTVDDRTDLLELLEDRRNGARLVKVLAQRNMTLSELIDHRQRGSSQLHLAEIFNNRSQESHPEPPAPAPTHQSLDVVTAFKNFPSFNLGNVKSVVPDDIKTDSQGSSYFTSIIQIKPTDDGLKEGRALKEKYIPKPIYDSATVKSSSDFFQSWDSNNLDSDAISSTTTTRRSIISFPRMAPSPISPVLVDSIDMDMNNVYKGIEQIESNSGRTQDIIDMELSGHGYKRNPIRVEQQLPVGVRSAIIASSSIVGVSLLIFIVIFATCRWRQRRKKTFNYAENFQAVRSRLPILTERESARSNSNSGGGSSKRSTSPPMVFHTSASGCVGGGGFERGGGGRSSKINTMDPNSPEVQEYLFDAMRKPFQ